MRSSLEQAQLDIERETAPFITRMCEARVYGFQGFIVGPNGIEELPLKPEWQDVFDQCEAFVGAIRHSILSDLTSAGG